jgi:hypothetical protein
MSNESKKTDQGNDGALYAIFGVAILGFVLMIVARLPILITGYVIGLLMLYQFNEQKTLVDKVKGVLGTAIFFYFGFYLSFGVEWFKEANFSGLLSNFDWYKRIVTSLVMTWNEHVPNYLAKSLKVVPKQVTTATISSFIFTSLIAGNVVGLIAPILYKHFSKKKSSNHDETFQVKQQNKFLNWIKNLPYQIVSDVVFAPISFVVHLGHRVALKIRNLYLPALAGAFVWFTIFSLIAFIFAKAPSGIGIKSKDMEFLIGTVVAFTPLLSFLTGLILGFFPFLGDSVLFHLFGSAPKGIKLFETKERVFSGFKLGTSYSTDDDYVLTESNINHHIQIVAPSGGGKTNILKNLISDRIKKGHGVIFLDYKADFEVAEYIYNVANTCNRAHDVRVFSLSNREISVPYNPLSHGKASELESRLINAFIWSEPYYKNKAESALLKLFRGLCELRDLGYLTITIKTVYEAFSKKGYARELAQKLKQAGGQESGALEDLAQMLDRPTDAKELQGLITNLEKIVYSGAGELLTSDAECKSLSISEAIDQGLISYFLMNSMSSKDTASSVGKLLLQDLMGYVGRVYDRGASSNNKITIIIDEFAEFAIPEFPNFLSRVRGAGFGVVIAHQSRGNLKGISETYQNDIESNTNTKIIAGVTDPGDADFYAKIIGTRKTIKETHQMKEEGFIFKTEVKTGIKSAREVDEYIIHPNVIKALVRGQALVISRMVDAKYGLVRIPMAKEQFEQGLNRDQVYDLLKTMRDAYVPNVIPGLKQEITNKEVIKTTRTLWE